jgi:hypothetical protein
MEPNRFRTWRCILIPTFEGGWICKACWTANRPNDLRCYRCAAIQPGYHEVPVGPRRAVVRPMLGRGRQSAGRAIHGVSATAARGATSVVGRGMAASTAIVRVSGRAVGRLGAFTAGIARSSVRGAGRMARSISARVTGTVRHAARGTGGLVRHAVAGTSGAVQHAAIGTGGLVRHAAAGTGGLVRSASRFGRWNRTHIS